MPDRPAASDRLLVFARFPKPGKVKTRLISTLGATGAANLQARMTEHTLTTARRLAADRALGLGVCCTGASRGKFRSWLGRGLDYLPQCQGDLGRRMHHAFLQAFRAGCQRVVLIGTDCPGLTPELLQQAFAALIEQDVVLGPATDGGYYLIGLRHPAPELFQGIRWGSESVFAATLQAAAHAGLRCLALEPLSDVDRIQDLAAWHASRSAPTPRLSIIIPALNEERVVPGTLNSIGDQAWEVLVADGGSRDQTRELAQAWGARVITVSPGRARQMNAGAAAAHGDFLLFLHADTRLPKDYAVTIRHLLGQPDISAGAFGLGLDAPDPRLDRIVRWANRRSRWLGLPYGDQGFFVRAGDFRQVGGFPDLPLLEDIAFLSKLRRRGRIVMAYSQVKTSARRWKTRGVWRTTLLNQAILCGYALGISPQTLARWYGAR